MLPLRSPVLVGHGSPLQQKNRRGWFGSSLCSEGSKDVKEHQDEPINNGRICKLWEREKLTLGKSFNQQSKEEPSPTKEENQAKVKGGAESLWKCVCGVGWGVGMQCPCACLASQLEQKFFLYLVLKPKN